MVGVDEVSEGGCSAVVVRPLQHGVEIKGLALNLTTDQQSRVRTAHIRVKEFIRRPCPNIIYLSDGDIAKKVEGIFDMTPYAIETRLKLRNPIYSETAAYGHFGRSGPGFTWERTDRADALRKAAGLGAAAIAEVGARV